MPDYQKLFYSYFLSLLNLYYIIVTIRFRLIKNAGRHLLLKVYTNPHVVYQNHHTVAKSKSVYEKSLRHLAFQAVLLNTFQSTLKRSENRPAQFYHKKYFWFIINWKRNQTASEVSDDPKVQLETYNCILRGGKIIFSHTKWLYNNLMDAAQKMICKPLRKFESNQSVLKWQKRGPLF